MSKRLHMIIFITDKDKNDEVVFGNPKMIKGHPVSNAMMDIKLNNDFEFYEDFDSVEIGEQLISFLEEVLHTAKTGKLKELR
jgi:hypothetical protein